MLAKIPMQFSDQNEDVEMDTEGETSKIHGLAGTTNVTLANRENLSIQKLKYGDKILSYNFETKR
jgi:hypothetical protein